MVSNGVSISLLRLLEAKVVSMEAITGCALLQTLICLQKSWIALYVARMSWETCCALLPSFSGLLCLYCVGI